MTPALLKWIGNKQRFAETIISYMPEQINNYYEPFLGSGAVLAELLASNRVTGHAYGNDILPFLIDVFTIVKSDPTSLIKYYREQILEYYDNPENKYLEIRKRFNENHNPLDFCLLSRTCYSGVIRFRKSDGHMSTPRGPHKPISPEVFEARVKLWNQLLQNSEFSCGSYTTFMDQAQKDDVIYCDPPYTHSQGIIYGAQDFNINDLWKKISECKQRGAKVLLSINGTRDNGQKDISITPPDGLFERTLVISCGTSMIDRLQNSGKTMTNKRVDDQLLLTW